MKRTIMYLHLFHGRPDPAQDMDNWGEDGPVLRIEGFHVTYISSMRVGVGNLMSPYDDWCDLFFVDDCLYYDGVYYGDFSIFAEGTDPILSARATDFDPRKAVPPIGG